MIEKFKRWLKSGKVETGNLTDFPNAEECDPNAPCRHIEPRKYKGLKVTLPAFFEWWFKPKGEE